MLGIGHKLEGRGWGAGVNMGWGHCFSCKHKPGKGRFLMTILGPMSRSSLPFKQAHLWVACAGRSLVKRRACDSKRACSQAKTFGDALSCGVIGQNFISQEMSLFVTSAAANSSNAFSPGKYFVQYKLILINLIKNTYRRLVQLHVQIVICHLIKLSFLLSQSNTTKVEQTCKVHTWTHTALVTDPCS